MKYLIFLLSGFLLFSCSNSKSVYWCGDHACINKKEREAYFKKTMIVEKRELNKKSKKDKSELEIIKQRAGLNENKKIVYKKELTKQPSSEKKVRIKNKKELAKQIRLEDKLRIKEQKRMAKQARLEEKLKIKKQKRLAKQARRDKKMRIKEDKKLLKNKNLKTDNKSPEKKVVMNIGIAAIDFSSLEFKKLVEKIKKKNMSRPFPNINDIPN